ncbi:MAG: hypothetical protein VB048_00925 [Bacteroidaceae bacterium]|nr:hypothetical protein [Bacteroidaceae bacterium]
MQISSIVSIVIGFIAVVIAFWQARISKDQLEESKATKTETEKLLVEIKSKVEKIDSISSDTKRNIEEQIRRMIDRQDENFKILLASPKEKNQNDLLMAMLPKVFDNPELFAKVLEISQKAGKGNT